MVTLMRPPGGSGQLRNTDPVYPFHKRDLRVLAVAESAAEDTGTVLPLHLSSGRKVGLSLPGLVQRGVSSASSLTRLAAGKSCSAVPTRLRKLTRTEAGRFPSPSRVLAFGSRARSHRGNSRMQKSKPIGPGGGKIPPAKRRQQQET
jgi:hypothetical protein